MFAALALSALASTAAATNILLSNDDGWAVANIRAQNDALKATGHNVVLSCPAVDRSGTGSSTAEPESLDGPCQFDTCPAGSPGIGHNESDPRLNWVNAFPVDATRIGIQNLSQPFFNGNPELVVAGSNVGNNLGNTVLISGTIGAATEAALEGISSLAFSGGGGGHVSFTELETDPDSDDSVAAFVYAELTTTFVNTVIDNTPDGERFVPEGISVNVNYPDTADGCASADAFSFVFSRIHANDDAEDVETCGSTHLPAESDVVGTDGCFASVSVFGASTKDDVDAETQQAVLDRVSSILTCLP